MIKSRRFECSFTSAVLIAVSSISMTGCLGASTAREPAGDTGVVEQPTEKTCDGQATLSFVPHEIKGHQHLYFGSDALDALLEANSTVESVLLKVEIEGKHNDAKSLELEIGLNGISMSRADGRKGLDELKNSNSAASVPSSSGVVQLHKMRLNGAEPLLSFLTKIRKNKGELRISLQGKSVKVLSAVLEIQRSPKKCPTSPTPPPAVAPTARISGSIPAETESRETTRQISFAADQSGVTFSCSLNGAAGETCSSPAVYSNLESGSYSFIVTARNAQGLTSVPAQYDFTIDALPAIATIEDFAPLTSSMAATISFSANEIASFECSLDHATPVSCTSPIAYSALNEGVHRLEVFTVDRVGNRSTNPAVAEWRVDLTAPTAQIVGVSPEQSSSASTERRFDFAADESSTFECALDAAPFAPCESPHVASGLGEGVHRFAVRATDSAGNVGVETHSSWVTDLTPPVVTLSSVLPAAGATNARSASVEFSANEPGTFLCSFSGGQESTCTSPYNTAFVADGPHNLQITAVDVAGLRSEPVNVSWVVDTLAPEIRFGQILPSSSAFLSASEVRVSIEASEDAALSAVLNGVALESQESPLVLTDLSEGSYELVVTGIDSAGNATNSISHRFVIDRTLPIATLASSIDSSPTRLDVARFDFSANENVDFACDLDSAGFGPCVSPLELSGLIEGEHVFRLRATDAAGNESLVQERAWSIDKTAPLTTLALVQVAARSFKAEFQANESTSQFLCSLDGAQAAACVSPLSLTNLAPGEHTLLVQSVDAAGNVDTVGARSKMVALASPTVQLASPGVIFTNQTSIAFSFTSNLSDAKFVCSIDNSPQAACVSPRAISGLSDGVHTFKVWAVDRFGEMSSAATYSWTVDTVAPVIVTSSSTVLSTSITISWTTNEDATSYLNWGQGTTMNKVTAETTTYATSHSARLSLLSPNTVYTVQITGRDRAGNIYKGAALQIRTRY